MEMGRKTILALVCSLLVMPIAPTAGWSHHYHGDYALAWGLTGLFVGSTLATFAYRPPPVVYAAAPPVYRPPVTAYAPAVPAGMCRWERYVLDRYGRPLLDRYGQPIKEYTLGSCHYPPY
jgi:hypothetical protein